MWGQSAKQLHTHTYTESSLTPQLRQHLSLLSIHPHHPSLSISGLVCGRHVSLVIHADTPSFRPLLWRRLWWTTGYLSRHKVWFAQLWAHNCGLIDQCCSLAVEPPRRNAVSIDIHTSCWTSMRSTWACIHHLHCDSEPGVHMGTGVPVLTVFVLSILECASSVLWVSDTYK